MGCGANCARYLLFVFNLVFFFGGVAVAVVGAIILGTDFVEHSRATLNDAGNYDTLAIVLIVIGCTVLIIAFLGCCGAIRKNHCMLITFALLILIVVIAQVVIGVIAVLSYNKTEEELHSLAVESLQKTNGSDHTFIEGWEYTQEKLKCCGVDGPDDWDKYDGTPYHDSKSGQGPQYPDQCCKEKKEGCAAEHADPFQEGCVRLIAREFKESSLVIGLVALIIGLLELLGVVFAWCVATQVKREERAGY